MKFRRLPMFCQVCSIIMLAWLSCTPKPRIPQPRPEPTGGPMIRVAVIQDQDEIIFSCGSAFQVVDERGQVILSSSDSGSKWKVQIKFSHPASIVYRRVLYEVETMEMARQRAERLQSLGFQVKIIEVGKAFQLGSRTVNDNRIYFVTIGPYPTAEEARSASPDLPADIINSSLPEISQPSLGALDLIDPDGQVVFSSAEPFALVPKGSDNGFFTLRGVVSGRGFAWERQEDRSYRGKLECRLGKDGHLLVINELPLEDYLRGVLPKEMNPGFPPAALRAQAIAARSYTIARWGHQHPLDPFDLCADVHCQAYAGRDREDPVTDLAVEETRGQVLVYEGKVCQTYYSSVCGGHTESNDYVWGNARIPYLVASYDAAPEKVSGFPGSLDRDEDALRAWVTSAPEVYCNQLSLEAPAALHYTRKHFRWAFTFSRQEMEEIVRQKSGQTFGRLRDIVPLERGPSGRLTQVRIVGESSQFVVAGELNIRRVLSPNHLPSSCFVIDREMGPDGLPSAFTFQGAGWGHGVGMCQTGAAGMALHGLDHEEILNHYYRGARLITAYGAVF